MKLTGKAIEAFEKWYLLQSDIQDVSIYAGDYNIGLECLSDFHSLTPSMQYGVYEDFFDSVGVDVSIRSLESDRFDWRTYEYSKNDITYSEVFFETRPEARTAAITKASEIYNNRTT
jgi:hypothetical protein